MPLENGINHSENEQRFVVLSELMIERNSLLDILYGIKHLSSQTDPHIISFLKNKFLSKIALIDKRISFTAAGLKCPICQKKLEVNDEMLVCQWCGSPAHKMSFLNYVKRNGFCPACGEYLKLTYFPTSPTITQDMLHSCISALTRKFPQITISYGDKYISTHLATDSLLLCPECKSHVSPDWNFCRYCGARLDRELSQPVVTSPCPNCGRPVRSSWRFCKLCGHPLNSS
ncbi:MAG: zinc ribbon domain-containing protein [Candidatus Helarchaeota archaeon]